MRKKVLFLIESLAGGGAENVLSTIVKYLDKAKFDITLCCVSNVGPFLRHLPSSVNYHYILPDPSELTGIKLLLYRVKYKLVHSWLPTKWVYRFFVPKGNDIEVAFVEGFATKLVAASPFKRTKKIAWVHIDLAQLSWTQDCGVFRGLEDEIANYSRFDRIVCVSKAVSDAFKKVYKPRPNVSVVYNPIDSDNILSRSKEDCRIPDKSKLRLVSMGRLVPQKAFDRLLRVASRLMNDGFDFDLWIMGDGICRNALNNLVEKEGLSDRVVLWGFKPNPYPYLASADLFVCSSLAEGYSTAATEAIVLGIPVVTTDCAGMREMLVDSGCGLITSNDEMSLYQGLKTVLESPSTLMTLKKAALEKRYTFSINGLMAPIEALLEEC